MHEPSSAFLKESDPSKAELVNPGEYRESAASVQSEVDSSSSSVGSGEARGGDFSVVLRATITGGDDKRGFKSLPQGIELEEEFADHLVFTATTAAGEFIRFEVFHKKFTALCPS